MGALQPALPVHLQPVTRGLPGIPSHILSSSMCRDKALNVQKERMHPVSPVGWCAIEGLSYGQPDHRPFCIHLGQRPLLRAGLRPISGALAQPACSFGSGAGHSDKCLFSSRGGGQDVMAFPSCLVLQWFSQSGH